MPPKKTLPSTKNDNPDKTKQVSILLSAISILSTIIIGVLSIVNTKKIAELDRVVYVPKLEYRFIQSQISNLSLEVRNYGYTSAKNVIVSINWKDLELVECLPSPPYQNLSAIEPIYNQNLSYHLETLNISGVFRIECQLEMIDATGGHYENKESLVWDFSPPYYIKEPRPRLFITQTEITQEMLSAVVVSENSAPAVEIERPEMFTKIVYVVLETLTP